MGMGEVEMAPTIMEKKIARITLERWGFKYRNRRLYKLNDMEAHQELLLDGLFQSHQWV